MAKKKHKPIGKLKEEAAILFQKLRKLQEADKNGNCKCVTCGKIGLWSDMQGGHFFGRSRSATLLDPMNVFPQCPGCNAFLMKTTEGILKYQDFLVSRFGIDAVEELREKSKQSHKWDRIDLQDKIAEYKQLIKEHALSL